MKISWIDKPTYINEKFIDAIGELGDFEIFNDIPVELDLIERLNNTDIAIVEWSRITKNVFNRITRCKYILLATTSFDNIDLNAYKRQKQVIISNCTGYCSNAVAEWTIAMLMSLNRNIMQSHKSAFRGESHLYTPFLSRELKGKTLGLIGTGAIGKRVGALALALGLKLIGNNASETRVDEIELVKLEELLARSDFVSIQVPSTSANRIINQDSARHVKDGQIIVSCSRSSLIDIDVMLMLLENGRVRALGLDDLDISRDHKIWTLDNVSVTTGIAWYTEECRQANLDVIYLTIKEYIQNGIVKEIGVNNA